MRIITAIGKHQCSPKFTLASLTFAEHSETRILEQMRLSNTFKNLERKGVDVYLYTVNTPCSRIGPNCGGAFGQLFRDYKNIQLITIGYDEEYTTREGVDKSEYFKRHVKQLSERYNIIAIKIGKSNVFVLV